MNETRSLLASGLLGALCVASLSALVAPTVAPSAAPNTKQTTWPPHPKHIVQFVETHEVSVAPDGFFDVYQVPEDAYLVVELLTMYGPETDPLTLCGFEPFEEQNGVLTQRGICNGLGGAGSGTGAVFAPGSKILARNITGQTTTSVTVNMQAYLSPAR